MPNTHSRTYGGTDVAQIYLPITAPVQAAQYTTAEVLPRIKEWVEKLRDQQLVHANVRFEIRKGPDDVPVAMLRDPEHNNDLLLLGSYLVFTGHRLCVLPSLEFHRRYRAPDRREHAGVPR